MKVNQVIMSLAAMLILSTSIFAQPPSDRHEKMEKIKAMKVEFITTKLNLTVAEAQKFWPVYNEFTDKLFSLEKERRETLQKNRNTELSDDEVNALIKMNFDTDQKILDLKREYDGRFKEVLSVQKVGKLYMAEEQFKREMLRRMKGPGGPPR